MNDKIPGSDATAAIVPPVGDVRGRRFMMCIEYVADKATRAPSPTVGASAKDTAE